MNESADTSTQKERRGDRENTDVSVANPQSQHAPRVVVVGFLLFRSSCCCCCCFVVLFRRLFVSDGAGWIFNFGMPHAERAILAAEKLVHSFASAHLLRCILIRSDVFFCPFLLTAADL